MHVQEEDSSNFFFPSYPRSSLKIFLLDKPEDLRFSSLITEVTTPLWNIQSLVPEYLCASISHLGKPFSINQCFHNLFESWIFKCTLLLCKVLLGWIDQWWSINEKLSFSCFWNKPSFPCLVLWLIHHS